MEKKFEISIYTFVNLLLVNTNFSSCTSLIVSLIKVQKNIFKRFYSISADLLFDDFSFIIKEYHEN
tara:strand:- start:74 stop:271 length:198 start_codon:yes stop_codon:yes gene_type:complete